ncbi:MAG: MATE family efflux transporter [Deinococcota bacterium]|nr:MATE family efflux transporter [Deinococcota bacterium]
MTGLASYRRYLPILGQVWRLSLPVIVANLFMTMVNVVDVFMAGRLGPVEIAAVGMASSVRLLVLIAILAVTAGSMALAAQAHGARDPAGVSFVARQSYSLTLILGLTLSVIGWFAAEPLLTFLNSGGDPRAVELGAAYLKILFLGTIFLNFNFVNNSLMQGAGDTVTPLYITAGINVLNVLFNYLFMFGPGPLPAYGVAGAAMGTVLSRVIAAGVGFYIFRSGRNVIKILPGSYKPDLTMFRDILAIGIPSGLQGVVRNSAQLFVLRIVTSTAAGSYGAAALAVGIQIESLAFMPGLAISVAATSLVGRSLGAWQVSAARIQGNVAIFLGVVVMSLIALPLFVFAPAIIRLFDPSAHPTVVEAGTAYIRINALFQPLLAIAMVTNGTLRGAGDTRPGLIGTLIGRWLVVVPLAYLLALQLGMGVNGVWWALVTGTTVQALYILLRWRSGTWQEVALKKTKVYRRYLHNLPQPAQARFLHEVRGPLLALENTTEHVGKDRVEYRGGAGTVTVRFEGGDFRLEDPGSCAPTWRLREGPPHVAASHD